MKSIPYFKILLCVFLIGIVSNSCEVDVTPRFNLDAYATPYEGGTINISPNSFNYKKGEFIYLTAKPNAGWVFEKWEGDGIGTANPLEVIITSDQLIWGVFKRKDYPLNITIEGEGTVEERIVSNPSGRQYPFQTVVELTPVAKEGWVFDRFEGDLTGTESPQGITVNREKNVTVIFKRRDYPLNIIIEGEGTVEERIVSNPSGRQYPFETVVELTPVAKEGWVFDRFEGDLTGNTSPQNITVDSEKNVTVIFKRRDYPLNINIEGEGTVEERIVSNPSERQYPFETVVELTPVAKEGWVFDRFEGDLTGNTSPQNITVDSEKNVTVIFKRKDYPLNITIEGEGTVEERILTNPSGRQYPFETVVELTPVAKEGWVFDRFEGDLTGSQSPQNITVTEEKNVTVIFKRRDYPLNITIDGEGTVEERIVTNPSGRQYPFETVVELTPVAKEGWVFDRFEGDLTGTESPQNITVNSEKNVTVIFKRRDYPLNITIEGEGTVEERIVTNPSGRQYPFETVVELTPVAKEGWVFDRFEGDLTGTESPQNITVNSEKNVTVIFKRRDYPLNITIEGEGTVEERIVTNPSGRQYPFETVVELTPVAKEGWVFDRFEGDLTGTETPQTITINGEKNVKVIFKEFVPSYPLNITIEGEGTVEKRIVTNPSGREEYPFETTVELTPVPKRGWVFDSFEGDLTGSQSPQNITINEEKNVTVIFKRKDYPLTIIVEGNGRVEERVVFNPNQREYPFQTEVELTPIAEEGWIFDGWEGFITTTQVPLIIKVNSPTIIIARFKRRDYPLNITIEGEGTVEERIVTNPSGRQYPFETVVELTPVAKEGWVFDRFEGDLTGSQSPQNITVTEEKNVIVIFKEAPKFYLNENGVTCMCPNAVAGEKGLINGEEYEAVDNQLLRQRVEEQILYGGIRLDRLCTTPVTNMSELFTDVRKDPYILNPINQPIGNWDVSNVTDMNGMFSYSAFNQPIDNWDVSNVTDMSGMFSYSAFNQPIDNWDVSKVTDMSEMFSFSVFNQPISKWDVSNVSKMSEMFAGSVGSFFFRTEFNQPIGDWDVSKVTNMSGMFSNSPFNQPIGGWDVSNVENMNGMFSYSEFNQPIEDWDVSNVRNMNGMFSNSPFNQPVGGWDVSNVENMNEMFSYSLFNQPIGGWDVSNVENMNEMFFYSEFNQNISTWCVTQIPSEPQDFSNISPLIEENKPKWGTCPDN